MPFVLRAHMWISPTVHYIGACALHSNWTVDSARDVSEIIWLKAPRLFQDLPRIPQMFVPWVPCIPSTSYSHGQIFLRIIFSQYLTILRSYKGHVFIWYYIFKHLNFQTYIWDVPRGLRMLFSSTLFHDSYIPETLPSWCQYVSEPIP